MDRDPALARVIFDLPRRDVPELMVHLGNFAVDHDIALEISDAPVDVTQASLNLEEVKYNQTLITLLPDEAGKEQVAVVTARNLAKFAEETKVQVGVAKRAINQLGRAAVNQHPELLNMMYGEDTPWGMRATGIRVDHIKAIRELLVSGGLKVTDLGQISIGLLSAYCDALFFEGKYDSSQQENATTS